MKLHLYYKDRVDSIRKRFDELKIDAFLITFLPHLRYITGFSGSNGIALVTRSNCYLITDGRYTAQVRAEVIGWKIVIAKNDIIEEFGRQKILHSGMRVGFDGNSIIFSQFKSLKKNYPAVKFLPLIDCIESIACVKDEIEISKIIKAVEITDVVFKEILSLLKPGITELDIAAEISYRHKKHGAQNDGFEPIIASGFRGALPHGRASSKKIKNGEMVTLDFGCIVEGYHSDMTRTVSIGKPKSEMKKVYQIVYDAQLKALEAAKNGVKAADVDAVARKYIHAKGFGKYFRHSLGHGIGLQIHEQPRLSVLSKATLRTGNVVTIEPGIYLPEMGGVRIEDDIVVRNGYCDILNKSPKDLLVL